MHVKAKYFFIGAITWTLTLCLSLGFFPGDEYPIKYVPKITVPIAKKVAPELEINEIPVVAKFPDYIFPIHEEDFIWDGKGGNITSPYGERNPHEIGGLGDFFHNGLDLWGVSHVGTWHARIVAIADGTILNHWINHPVYGKMIEIQHDDGSVSVYAHLSKSFIHEKRADGTPWRVEQGEVIGRQGRSGMSKGMLRYSEHLHFELRIQGETVNPLKYIRVPE